MHLTVLIHLLQGNITKICNVTTSHNSTSVDLIIWHHKHGTSNSKGCEFVLMQGDTHHMSVPHTTSASSPNWIHGRVKKFLAWLIFNNFAIFQYSLPLFQHIFHTCEPVNLCSSKCTIYPSQHVPFCATFVCQARNFWTLLCKICKIKQNLFLAFSIKTWWPSSKTMDKQH
jgi:hypothetical protein